MEEDRSTTDASQLTLGISGEYMSGGYVLQSQDGKGHQLMNSFLIGEPGVGVL